MTEYSTKNNQAIESINNKLLQIMNDRGITTSFLLSPLSKITNPVNTNHIKLVKYSSSNRVNDLLLHNSKPITLHENL